MTRRTKTPAERAQEQYDVAARVAARLTRKVTDATADLATLTAEAAAAVRRRDYLSNHPDLPQQKSATTTEETPA